MNRLRACIAFSKKTLFKNTVQNFRILTSQAASAGGNVGGYALDSRKWLWVLQEATTKF